MKKNRTFTGGLLFKADMEQSDLPPLCTLPPPSVVTIPLLQHAGDIPARPVVKQGDFVSMGQLIGKAGDGSAAVHSSVSGTVQSISRYPFSRNPDTLAVSIENNGEDEFASPIPFDTAWTDATQQELAAKISLAGIVDFSGTELPIEAKLTAAHHAGASSLILNAMVTEPFAGADYRLLLEQTEKVLTGGLICRKIAGAKTVIIAINEKNDAIEKVLAPYLAAEPFKTFSLLKIKPKYPQHNETLLTRTCRAALPDSGDCTVISVASAAYIRDAVMESIPWYQRIVTVGGEAAGKRKDFMVRIGTPVGELLKAAETDLTRTASVISGGPLSGAAFSTLDTPVTKSTSAVLALAEVATADTKAFACINCGKCIRVCPMRLAPSRLASLAQKKDFTEARAWRIDDCIECGCCAYVCPSAINLVHAIQYGKQLAALHLQSKAAV